MSVEIRMVGFKMQDFEALMDEITNILDNLGLKDVGHIVYDNSYTRLCLTDEPYPHVAVCSDVQEQLNTVALQINGTLGVMVKKQLCQDFLDPIPIEDWIKRGR